MSDKCESYNEVLLEIKRVEKKVDARHESYIVNNTEIKGIVKALHKRLDLDNESHRSLAQTVTKHMADESLSHEQAAISRSKTNELLRHVATKADIVGISGRLTNAPSKEDLAKTDGRVNTIWIIGGVVGGSVLLMGLVLLWYIKADINEHTTKSYDGTKKAIERIIK